MADQHVKARYYYQRVQYLTWNEQTQETESHESVVAGQIGRKRARTILEQQLDRQILITGMQQYYDVGMMAVGDFLKTATIVSENNKSEK